MLIRIQKSLTPGKFSISTYKYQSVYKINEQTNGTPIEEELIFPRLQLNHYVA